MQHFNSKILEAFTFLCGPQFHGPVQFLRQFEPMPYIAIIAIAFIHRIATVAWLITDVNR